MKTVKIKFKNIKNIEYADIELPLENGVYSIIGGNGCGKSTLMLIFSVLASPRRYSMFQQEDYQSNSKIIIETQFKNNNYINTWTVNKKGLWGCKEKWIQWRGVYEGSLFYGARFDNSKIIDQLIKDQDLSDKIIEADSYVQTNMSYILHGHREAYKNLKRIKNRTIAKGFGLINIPYFIETSEKKLVSQYRMSSGECLLVSLLNYIYYTIINQGKPLTRSDTPILILIDEIELALHPIAISRLIEYLEDLSKEYPTLVTYLTSHSPEVIRSLAPENMFLLKNENGRLTVNNPCYPSYAIRDVYRHDGFDYLILVEDKLAAQLINSIIYKEKLINNKLIHISPVGGYENVLQLHADLLANNVIGMHKSIISVLDGDVENEVKSMQEFKNLKKLFLPIASIEKYLFEVIYNNQDVKLRKLINDKYFTLSSLDEIISDFNKNYKSLPSQANKKFYFKLKKDLENRKISEELFIEQLIKDIKGHVDFRSFTDSLKKLLS